LERLFLVLNQTAGCRDKDNSLSRALFRGRMPWGELPAMHDLSRFPTVTPELLLGSEPLPPPSGPVRFSLGDAPESDRPALLQECFARLGYRYQMNRLPDVPFTADLTLNMLPGLLMMAGRLHGSCNERSRAHVEDGTDDVALIVNVKGAHRITQGKHELVLGDGEAVFLSCSDACSFTHKPPGDLLGLRFPKAAFAPLVNGVQDRTMQRIPSNAQALRFLTNYIGLAWDEQTTASRELQHLMAGHVYDLMAVMIGATRDAAQAAEGRGLRAARLHAIKQDVAANLGRCDLSVAQLAERHGCTPRLIQRLFEMEGTTLTDYLLAQRLARAHRMLTDPRRAAEKISTIAFDAGFGDLSYFNRVFRRQYGETPSAARGR
jgi:AraC-like DNA-binding protein